MSRLTLTILTAAGITLFSLRKVKPSGYITGDDYMEGGWWEGGVKKAVDEFVCGYPIELLAIRNEQFVLGKQCAASGRGLSGAPIGPQVAALAPERRGE